MSKKISEKIVSQLLTTMQNVGPEQTLKGLEAINRDGNHYLQFVRQTVCAKLVIEFDALVNEITRSDEIIYGRGFIVYFSRKHFDVDWKELCGLLNRKQNSLWKSLCLIKDLKPGSKHDQPWIAIKEELDVVMKKYKKGK